MNPEKTLEEGDGKIPMCKNCKGTYYITSAIAYASGKPHIGNTYEIVLADAIARYKRQEGYEVYYQTGTDEHGQKNELKAQEAGVTPKEYVDGVSAEIKRIWDLMNTSYDNFIRTTDEDHKLQVQKIFRKLYDQGDIYKGAYEGWYCTPCESFWTETQLVDGKCPDCGRDVQLAKEEAYFFKMSKYADRLMAHIEAHPEFIQPVSRKNEMVNNFLKPGLQDLCVSRTSFTWGIPVDFDPKHVVYVWLDALSNYITKMGYDADGNSSDLFRKFWPADLHLIGKDIIRFHTIYWPIFLMALDVPLPKQVFGHPWLLMSDGKMSKSKGNVLYADDLVSIFGVDAVRYFLLHEMPFDNDGVISWDLMVERTNSDLANTLGNLVKRTISMSCKYFDGEVRNPKAASDTAFASGTVAAAKGDADDERTGLTEAAVDADLKAVVSGARDKVAAKMDELRVADAISEVFAVFRRCNKYIDENEPWVLARDEEKKDRLATVMYHLIEGICVGANLLASFLPETSEKILKQVQGEVRDFDVLDQFGLYPDGVTLKEEDAQILFARLKPEDVMKQVEALRPQEPETPAEEDPQKADAAANEGAASENGAGGAAEIPLEIKPEITFDAFGQMQFAVGEIIACEEVPKSKKLLCSQVKIGDQTRQIVSGIKKYYSAEEMVGKKVMVLVNLKPAKLAGVLSEGMLLCAEDADGNLALMTPEKDMPSGAEIC